MLKRKATTFIKNWLDTKDKKCLVVQGARQTGKTYIIERFAEENFEELLEINFKQMPSAMDIFAGDLTVDNMIMAMRFRFPEKKIVPGKTLIFLDEIQECQEAITSLKFWATDNRYDVITSGSLLGIDYKRASSYPVGYVDYLRMYGMDFEEFLWGMGISEEMIGNLCGYLHLKTVIPEAIHSQMMKYYRQYVATGGMPEVVQKYIDTKDFREVDRVQRSLLQGYQYDIAHYATAEEKVKAEKCYLSLAKQLLDKENHKFQYKEIEHGGRAQKYYSNKIVKRNEQKSENLDYLSSCTTIKVKQKTVPYSVYYVSCNLDHYLHRSANLDYRMKRSLADTFARTYIGDVEGFIKEISDDPGAVKGMSYDESWNYIKEDKNSLHRHTNLKLLFEKLLAKAES